MMRSVSTIPGISSQSLPAAPTAAPGVIGWWTGAVKPAALDQLPLLLRTLDQPLYVLRQGGEYLLANSGTVQLGVATGVQGALPLVAWLPPAPASQMGDLGFCRDYHLRFPYMTGAMANGIASTRLVTAIAEAGLLGSFGAAGLGVPQVAAAIAELQGRLPDHSFCINLIHSPNEKDREDQLVDLFIQKGIHMVEASAYMTLTLPALRYRLHGIHHDGQGNIVTPHRIIAKVSRVEVAERWFSPPPDKFLKTLLDNGVITTEQADLAKQIPVAQDLTVEADSGGHTDNRPAITLLPTMLALRDRLQKQFNYHAPLRVGAAGGIATPASVAAAFAMGAAYVVSGTINQSCLESGSSDTVRGMLAEAQQADTAMAAAGDMFELGVKVQVLKRGTLFAMRANKLYETYRAWNSLEAIPVKERENLEKTIFKAPLEQIWQTTREYFAAHDPGQIERAERDPKHKMALVFRWYLGLSSRWANAGVEDRQADYQIWCGPAMGAFNEWTRDSFLAQPQNRQVVTVALNLIFGAALVSRLQMLRLQGIELPLDLARIAPMPAEEIEQYLQ
ncbi:MAG: 2-nitropropane dioxygenase [Gammaproteobacteria bacterium]|nr:2-nitropropane dioxygenase [Gammaproteobacteria bacterium]